ncbi:uncharacterized protein BX663DRAFT_505542 [Cokeromyces recurvatus]|uniref:uncharacterized protein n=1 Tax=Cokeromyces recurvatus TaxID=90255 RepID=UPI00221FD48C|nr:uncharacterized protein BX663DRAFT_505542 [Cokeromyces recurvatus]KAI7903877.1 hypothetical protein BX663DRAFT_505542 [Cokeromyces recurvatus]
MKFTLLAGAISVISQVSAVIIVNPWADTTWVSGGQGEITWKITTADAGLKCEIYMLNGDYKNSNLVAQVTNPATPVDCSVGKYAIYPLNDFASGKYWIRIGQRSTGNWAYSAPFDFKGNGTAKPESIVVTPTAVKSNSTTAAVITTAPATTSTAKSSSSSSAETSKTTSNESGAPMMSISSAVIALGAIAAVALIL